MRSKEADDCRVVRRLCFVNNLYEGDTLKQATRRVGASRGTGSEWFTRWNENGLGGLVPRFGGGGPPKLSHQQSRDLQRLLEEGQPWTTNEVTYLIEEELGVSYHPGHVSRLLRHTYRMSYAIPRLETLSRPDNAEEILAERLVQVLGKINSDRREGAADHGETVHGFFR